jgi:hypothetical protein
MMGRRRARPLEAITNLPKFYAFSRAEVKLNRDFRAVGIYGDAWSFEAVDGRAS